jgi:hypothetical protein
MAILYFLILLGSLAAAGYAGGFWARHHVQSVARRIQPPVDIEIENLGFACGAAGGLVYSSFCSGRVVGRNHPATLALTSGEDASQCRRVPTCSASLLWVEPESPSTSFVARVPELRQRLVEIISKQRHAEQI